jgi:Predicted nucleotide-binding protein containing TIR-like domain
VDDKPVISVFIGSSTEGLKIARAVEYQLQHDAEVTVWNEGYFGLSHTTLETLVNSLERFDFAILILTPDDFVVSRDIPMTSPRDNVMFELGLFMGHLGRSRTFIAYDIESKLKIPSDLAGVTAAVFRGSRIDENIIAAVSPACTIIRETIKKLGVFEGRSIQRLQKATHQVENVSETVERLVYLLARSRTIELEIIAKQFGGLIATDELKKMLKDLQELEESTREKKQS